MRNVTVAITGANSGIGEATARALSAQGAQVVLLCRSTEKGEAACTRIRSEVPSASLSLHRCDLASFDSVRKVAAEILANYPRLHVLINNAGIYLPHRTVTADGLEMTVQVNHFGPFLLTHLLLERLSESAPARIINVSSEAHRRGRIVFDDLQSAMRYRAMEAYGTSKLMNILHVRALSRRLDPKLVTANALHPGVVATEFAQDVPSLFGTVFRRFAPLLKSPEQGAKTTVYLATDPVGAQVSGEYFAARRSKSPSAAATDDDAAERLWTASESLTGVSRTASGSPEEVPGRDSNAGLS